MSRKLSLLCLDGQLETLMLFVSTEIPIHNIVALQCRSTTENVAHLLSETFRGAPDLTFQRRAVGGGLTGVQFTLLTHGV